MFFGPVARRALLVLLCCVLSLGAFRQEAVAADAEDLIRRGLDLRRMEKDADALSLFQQAYDLTRTPRALVQVAFAEQALGKWGPADRHLRTAVQTNDPWVVKHRKAIDDALGVIGTHVGRLEVRGGPAGADVRVDGEVIGKLPLVAPVSVSAGGVAIDVRAEGYVPIMRASTVPTGVLIRETFDLQPLAVAPPTTTTPAVPMATDNPRAQGTEERPSPRAEPASPTAMASQSDAPHSVRPWLALGFAGLATAALTLGVIEQVLWQDKVGEFERTTGCNPAAAHRGSAKCEWLYDNGEKAKLWAYGGYGVGAGLLATAAILYLSAPAPGANSQQVACTVNPMGLSAGCAARF